MELEHSFGVRKGAWTVEEDRLLKNCMEKYGEGEWHRVPKKAGLHRCRKSCRLRWLNYLKPNIKRGQFEEDEVDLILRLHKLLGNRWSLIAGRLSGRTSNGVKNYWNTNLKPKAPSSPLCKENAKLTENKLPQERITKDNIIKPQPLSFSKNSCSRNVKMLTSKMPSNGDGVNISRQFTSPGYEDNCRQPTSQIMPPLEFVHNDDIWWDSILEDHGINNSINGKTTSSDEVKMVTRHVLGGRESPPTGTDIIGPTLFDQVHQSCLWSDQNPQDCLSFDFDFYFWDHGFIDY